MSNNDGVSALNNYLQGIGQASQTSWIDTPSGPAHAPQWTSICKIGGVEKGVGYGPSKTAAKDAAAREALKALGVQM